MCGEVYDDLKKIVKTKVEKSGLFTISYGKVRTKPLVQISADNFDYFCRALEGNFLDLDKTVNMSEHFVRVSFERDEIYSVMKEHFKYDDRDRPNGSYIIIGHDGKCATAMREATYQSMDVFEPIGKVQGVDDEFVAHLQSNYMMQVCDFYKGEDGITMWAKSLTSPVYFTVGDDSDSVAMLLPLRTDSEIRTSVINDYRNFFAA